MHLVRSLWSTMLLEVPGHGPHLVLALSTS